MEDELINTLVLPIEPKAARPPRLDRNGSVWAAAAKLGRYLTSGMTQEEREGLALPLLRVISRTAGEECEPPAASVASAFARRTKSRAHFLRAGEAWYVASMSAFPASHCGTHVWLWSHERNGRRGEAVTAFDIPTAVGALAVTDESDVVDRVLSRNKYVAAPIRERFFSLAAERWTVEENLAANRRYASAHSAGAFEDKLSCDEAHRGAAASSLFARRFAHVEIDDSVDLGQFVRLDREAAELADRGWLPAIGSDNSIRFRLCGRHRAIGVYSPSLKAIAIDPRAPRSGVHEMAHAYDFEHGQLSAKLGFRSILDRQRAALSGMDLTDSRLTYWSTPTEVFARAYELHLLSTGRASSMTSADVDALRAADPSVVPLSGDMDAIDGYFDGLGL